MIRIICIRDSACLSIVAELRFVLAFTEIISAFCFQNTATAIEHRIMQGKQGSRVAVETAPKEENDTAKKCRAVEA